MHRVLLGAVVLVTLLLGVGAGPASAATFSNSSPITINDSGAGCGGGPMQAQASPYPSQIQVSGQFGTLTDVNVTINGFSHPSTADVRMLLAGPHGQSTLLMQNVGSFTTLASNDVITFDDAAASMIPSQIVSGTFKPSQETHGCNFSNYLAFPPPAPSPGYSPNLAGFNGTDSNGTWSLYVVDAVIGDAGSISGGWSLDLAEVSPTTGQRAAALKKCKKKRSHQARKKCKRKAKLLPV